MSTTPTDAYAAGVACFQAGRDALAARAAGEALAGPYPVERIEQDVWEGNVRDLGNQAVDGWMLAEEAAAQQVHEDACAADRAAFDAEWDRARQIQAGIAQARRGTDRPVPTVPEIMAQEAGRPKSGDRW